MTTIDDYDNRDNWYIFLISILADIPRSIAAARYYGTRPDRNLVASLRQQGKSVREIQRMTGLPLSTIYYWLSGSKKHRR